MKKAIWINPFGGCSTSLDVGVSPHDVESIAVSQQLQSLGFEVWLQEPFVLSSKQSSWPNKIARDQLEGFSADLAILAGPTANLGTYTFGQESDSCRRKRDFDKTVEWLVKFKGEILIFVADPRPSFSQISFSPNKAKHPLYAIYSKSRCIAASRELFKEKDRSRIIISEYWKLVSMPLVGGIPESPAYRSVYPGVKGQNKARLSMLTDWFKGDEGIYTVGGIGEQLMEFPSLSDRKNMPLSGVLAIVRNSEFSLCCGEPLHSWLTPRVIQSLGGGTISAIHPAFGGLHHFSDEIKNRLVLERSLDFTDKLRTTETYNLQLDFLRDLRNSAAPLQL